MSGLGPVIWGGEVSNRYGNFRGYEMGGHSGWDIALGGGRNVSIINTVPVLKRSCPQLSWPGAQQYVCMACFVLDCVVL